MFFQRRAKKDRVDRFEAQLPEQSGLVGNVHRGGRIVADFSDNVDYFVSNFRSTAFCHEVYSNAMEKI